MEDLLAKFVAFAIVGVFIWLIGSVIKAFSKKSAQNKETDDEQN